MSWQVLMILPVRSWIDISHIRMRVASHAVREQTRRSVTGT
jgi:hypothetical protein